MVPDALSIQIVLMTILKELKCCCCRNNVVVGIIVLVFSVVVDFVIIIVVVLVFVAVVFDENHDYNEPLWLDASSQLLLLLLLCGYSLAQQSSLQQSNTVIQY